MKISKRLLSIASMCGSFSCVDVGADHGILTIFLASKEPTKTFLAIENKIGPFNILKKAVSESNLENISILYSDGIRDITNQYDCVILAGMGGLNVIAILKEHLEKTAFIDCFVVQVNSDIDILIQFLESCGYALSNYEYVYEEKQSYFILKFLKNESAAKLSFDYNFQYLNASNDQYTQNVQNELCKIKENIGNSSYLVFNEAVSIKLLQLKMLKRQ